jgi:hypothetical protein
MSERYLSLVLKVEILAGTSDKQAAIELSMLATDMGTIVEASQRGITMRAFPGMGWEKTLSDFERDERLNQYPEE